jgi:hypothetical protein
MALSTARVRSPTPSFDRILEVMDGVVGVEWRAPKAGALAEGLCRVVREDICARR